jgi:tRNA (cmo5U34)-methyltransferase
MTKDFSFARHAETFDGHISSSIPGYVDLMDLCVRLSGSFIQEGSTVIDIGCATGKLLVAIHEYNADRRKDVSYVGVDVEKQFQQHWRRYQRDSLRFEVRDARGLMTEKAISLAISIFTIQFMKPADKMPLLKRLYGSMADGGALLIAEKSLASSAWLQDALTFPYYDAKLRNGFRSKQILDKERSLRGQMTLWERTKLEENLQSAGFAEIQCVWGHFPFFCYLAVKR